MVFTTGSPHSQLEIILKFRSKGTIKLRISSR
jgi:hypothetical protein